MYIPRSVNRLALAGIACCLVIAGCSQTESGQPSFSEMYAAEMEETLQLASDSIQPSALVDATQPTSDELQNPFRPIASQNVKPDVALRLMGFADVNELKVVLMLNDAPLTLKLNQEEFGIRVIEISPQVAIIERDGQKQKLSLLN